MAPVLIYISNIQGLTEFNFQKLYWHDFLEHNQSFVYFSTKWGKTDHFFKKHFTVIQKNKLEN